MDQSHQTNGDTSVDSTGQQDDATAATESEETEDTLKKKLETIADNALQRNGSLIGTVERDRRKVSIM